MNNFQEDFPPKRPAIEQRPLTKRPAKKRRPVIGGSRKMWILDDDEDLCTLLLENFERIGWTAEVFHRPLPLLEALQEGLQPDLLLIDLLLPDKHGIDVLSRVRTLSHGFPILILSALSAPSDRVVGLEAGADDYLVKPFQFRELQLRSERLLRHHRGNDAELPSVMRTELAHPLQGGSYQLGPMRFEAADQPQLLTPDGACHRLGRGDGALLLAFCRHPHQVLSRAKLLQASGSLVSPGQTRTIDVRLSRLRRVLRNLTGTDLILPERGQGYKLNVEVRPLGDAAQTIPRTGSV